MQLFSPIQSMTLKSVDISLCSKSSISFAIAETQSSIPGAILSEEWINDNNANVRRVNLSTPTQLEAGVWYAIVLRNPVDEWTTIEIGKMSDVKIGPFYIKDSNGKLKQMDIGDYKIGYGFYFRLIGCRR